LVLGLLAAGLLSAGCSSGSKSDPGAVSPATISDKDARNSARIAAIEQSWTFVESGEAEHGPTREALKRVAWSRSTWHEVRVAALKALLADEGQLDDTRNMMRLMLPTETDWTVIELISTTAADRGWTDLTVALVRSWSRPVDEPTDDQRPERGALERLYPNQPVTETVYTVFVGRVPGGAELRDRDRRDAWSLLQRIDPDGAATVAMLSREPAGSDPMIEALRRCAADLGAAPTTAEQLEWAERLASGDNSGFWNEAASIVARLTPEQREGLGLRHAAILVWVQANRPAWLNLSRSEAHEQLERVQADRRVHTRESGPGEFGGSTESVRRWRDRLWWGDAIAALVAAEAIEDAAVASSLFAQAEHDRDDKSTEHGGVIDAGPDGSFVLHGHAPRPTQRMGDRRFVASSDMLDQSDRSLFHYHFHAQTYANRDYAGPSEDDLKYAARFGRDCIVFTFVSRDRLNADFYTPSGAVIDLGEAARPAGK